MGISFGSINTGLPKDIVKQLIAAERLPIQKMEIKKSKIDDKKKLVNHVIQLMKDLQSHILKNKNERDLREFKFTTNEDILGVHIDKNTARTGVHQLEVLALAQKSSAMTSGFPDRDNSYVGVGYIQYTLPTGESKQIYVDSNHATLDGIAKLVNQDENNGFNAKVINDGSGSETPWRIIFTLNETGDLNKAEFPYLYFVDGEEDLIIEFERSARDAKVKLDGFEIEVPENKISDIIPGVTIDLKKAAPGEEISINIAEDTGAISFKIKDLIEKINSVLIFIKEQNRLDEKSDTSRTLGGDITLQSLESRIRNTIFKNIETDFGLRRLGDLGIQFQREGTLKLDEKKFDAVLAKNYKLASQIITGSIREDGTKAPGFIHNFSEVVNLILRFPNGLLISRKNSLASNIKQINGRIANRQRMLGQKEQYLKQKFSRLEGVISRIQGQGAGLSALSINASSVQQLG